ncbi:hypothetical protein [Salipaludibacillus daqingensis]|uniref:hypothetical protein n=1 Tax=Salipaludibacillus daqingensis TaxID=3041001 RepID=UPI002476C252|nr:hypothetical protein [Salipaludibacillus daqingensis]
MEFPFALKKGRPHLDELFRKRRYDDIDLRRMFRDESILKDGNGYFIYEVESNPHSAPSTGKKVYIEKTFKVLEKKMMQRFDSAHHICESMLKQDKGKDRIHLYRTLMCLDYELSFLMNIYSGRKGYPFLSIRQVDLQLEEKLSLGIVCDVLMSKSSTPLGTIEQMEELLGKRYTVKQLKAAKIKGFQRNYQRDDHFLYTMPYGMNREKQQRND